MKKLYQPIAAKIIHKDNKMHVFTNSCECIDSYTNVNRLQQIIISYPSFIPDILEGSCLFTINKSIKIKEVLL